MFALSVTFYSLIHKSHICRYQDLGVVEHCSSINKHRDLSIKQKIRGVKDYRDNQSKSCARFLPDACSTAAGSRNRSNHSHTKSQKGQRPKLPKAVCRTDMTVGPTSSDHLSQHTITQAASKSCLFRNAEKCALSSHISAARRNQLDYIQR